MKPNTVIKLSDGRVGTICHNWLDGYGGKFGIFIFDLENLPCIDFLLRDVHLDESIKERLRSNHENPDLEFVGETYEIVPLDQVGDYQ